ncbi:MAG TPA: hypothetical protein VM364_00745 [Vicinamibacterales bacterium]|nr:hypothetical protein [Vicinamibacterales bacterium]
MASRAERALGEIADEFDDLPDDEDDFDGEPDEDEEDDDYLAPLSPADTVPLLAAARQEAAPRWLQADGRIRMPAGEMTCRVCGCSDSRACRGGCLWAAPNLCSRCVA